MHEGEYCGYVISTENISYIQGVVNKTEREERVRNCKMRKRALYREVCEAQTSES